MEAPLTRFQEIMYNKSTRAVPTTRMMQLGVCVKFSGETETAIFAHAASSLAARHPILCARLDGKIGELIQRYSDSPPSFEVIDVGADDQAAVAALSARADEPIDLFRENPFKIVVARVRHHVAFVLLVGHHVFIDDFALQQLLTEYVDLVVNPSRLAEEEPASWDSGDRSFFSYCREQDRMSRDGTFDKNGRYWLKYLAETDPILHFPGRPRDPDFQNLAGINFDLTPAEMRTSLQRAAELHVSHFALVVSAIFRVISHESCQENITLTIVYNARRPPYDRTVGQFAEAFLLNQSGLARAGKPADQQIKTTYGDIMKAIKNYVSAPQFADGLPWLVERGDKNFSSSDVYVNYISRMAALDSDGECQYEISYVPLTGRMKPAQSAYYGVVMSFTFRPIQDSLLGRLDYETSLINASLAQKILNGIRDELGAGAQ